MAGQRASIGLEPALSREDGPGTVDTKMTVSKPPTFATWNMLQIRWARRENEYQGTLRKPSLDSYKDEDAHLIMGHCSTLHGTHDQHKIRRATPCSVAISEKVLPLLARKLMYATQGSLSQTESDTAPLWPSRGLAKWCGFASTVGESVCVFEFA